MRVSQALGLNQFDALGAEPRSIIGRKCTSYMELGTQVGKQATHREHADVFQPAMSLPVNLTGSGETALQEQSYLTATRALPCPARLIITSARPECNHDEDALP